MDIIPKIPHINMGSSGFWYVGGSMLSALATSVLLFLDINAVPIWGESIPGHISIGIAFVAFVVFTWVGWYRTHRRIYQDLPPGLQKHWDHIKAETTELLEQVTPYDPHDWMEISPMGRPYKCSAGFTFVLHQDGTVEPKYSTLTSVQEWGSLKQHLKNVKKEHLWRDVVTWENAVIDDIQGRCKLWDAVLKEIDLGLGLKFLSNTKLT